VIETQLVKQRGLEAAPMCVLTTHVPLNEDRPPELAAPQHDGVVEQAAFREVLYERRRGLARVRALRSLLHVEAVDKLLVA
jgi:hypothetical protein